MRYQEGQGLNDTQREVRDLFKGIGSWKDGSKVIEDVITGFTYNINEGIQDLIAEVSELKAQLSLKNKECDALSETVDKLTSELRQKGDAHKTKSPPKPKRSHKRKIAQEDEVSDNDTVDADAQEVEDPMVPNGFCIGTVVDEDEEGHNTRNEDEDNAYKNYSNNPDKNRSLLMDPWNDKQRPNKEKHQRATTRDT